MRFDFKLSYLLNMGKRGRPPKKKTVPDTVPEPEQCYMILSSDEETGKKEEILRLPSPSQRRGVGYDRSDPIIITPPVRTTPSTDVIEEKTTLTRDANKKKKIILNGKNKKDDTSGDSDATEVYVQDFFFTKFLLLP